MMTRVLFSMLTVCCACGLRAAQVELTYTYADKHEEKKTVSATPDAKGVVTVIVKRSQLLQGVEWVSVLPEFASAKVGENGYYVTPDGYLGSFRLQNAACMVGGPSTFYGRNYMPIFGMKNPRATFVGIVATMRFEYDLHVRTKDGVYTIAPRFHVAGFVPPDDIVIHYHLLEGRDADYAGMARAYRNYQLVREVCKPIKARINEQPELAYAARSPEVRIRQGWKPAPSPVLEQSLATEPPMKAAVTFDRVGDILDAFKKAGVKRAQLCLAGWNQKGHDGRWPQIFPVEEALGGEEKLRRVIRKARRMGYLIVGHTNSSDGYSVADVWDWDLPAKREDGTPFSNAVWSGGQMYALCPQRAFERFYPQDIRKVADLGFRGLSGKHNAMHDRLIPIWQLVYNGIILNNPFTETVNASAKGLFTQTKLVEFNGRPSFYFYSRFKEDNKNWMGEIDLACATDEELKLAAGFVKKGCDEFDALSDLQFEFMEQHEQLAPDVFRTAFSNGAEIICNYAERDYVHNGQAIAPNRYRLFK